MKNLPLKLLSLFIAVLLSYLVNSFFVQDGDTTSVLQLIVPVEVQNLPQDKMIILPTTRQAEVSLQGSPTFLSKIAGAPPIIKVVVPPDAKNRFVASIRKDNMDLPPHVEVLRVNPQEIEFILDTKVSKEVSVVIPKIGSVSDDFKLEELRVEPSKVTISGPETEIKMVRNIESYPLDLRDVKNTEMRELDLRVLGKFSEVNPKQVVVEVFISPIRVEQKFDKLPIEIRATGGEAFLVSPKEVKVLVSVAKPQLKTLKKEEIIPYIKLHGNPEFGSMVKVELEVPKGVTTLSVDPENVQIVKSSGAVSLKKGKK